PGKSLFTVKTTVPVELHARATFGIEDKGREQQVTSQLSSRLEYGFGEPYTSRACIEAGREISAEVGSDDDLGAGIKESSVENAPSFVSDLVSLGRTGRATRWAGAE